MIWIITKYLLLSIALVICGCFRTAPCSKRKVSSPLLVTDEFIDGQEIIIDGSDEHYSTEIDNSLLSQGEDMEQDCVLPRLHPNSKSLMKWVVRHGGIFNATIKEANDGWRLNSDFNNPLIERGEVLLRIPKTLCIHSDPSSMARDDLLKNAKALMNSLSPDHWRARLAIALLSERVRSKSNYRSYLRNLPFEFWGMPMFFSTSEFALMQDYPLMHRTRDRCKFMSEFADTVLVPLQGGMRDPFSGNCADVNAFGWGFASASSRAIRVASIKNDASNRSSEHNAAVMIPGIDLVHHSFDPNCEVVETDSSYELRTLGPVEQGSELSICYGPLSNDELFADYGFTVANNPYDSISCSVDGLILDAARVVMGQSRVDLLASTDESMRLEARDMVLKQANSNAPNNGRLASIRKRGSAISSSGGGHLSTNFTSFCPWGANDARDLRYNENFLHLWQIYWLRCLHLSGPSRNYQMHIRLNTNKDGKVCQGSHEIEGAEGDTHGDGNNQCVDGRLLALLRVIYSRRESDLLLHGYTPFSLKAEGSMLSNFLEANVIKTVIGIMGLALTKYHTDIEQDVALLQSEDEALLLDSAADSTVAVSVLDDSRQEQQGIQPNGFTREVGPQSYGSGSRYLASLADGGDGNQGFRIESDKEGREEEESVVLRTRRILRNILTSTKEINERIIQDVESANAAALATMHGLQQGKHVQEIAADAEAAAEAALNNNGQGSSLEDLIVKKLRSELKGVVHDSVPRSDLSGQDDDDDDDDDDDGNENDEEDEDDGSKNKPDGQDEMGQLQKGDFLQDSLASSAVQSVPDGGPNKQVHFSISTDEQSYCEAGATKLSVNVRQAMLYRIRKKQGLKRLIEDLGTKYEALRGAQSRTSTPAKEASTEMHRRMIGAGPVVRRKSSNIPPLLIADDSFFSEEIIKAERTKRITELVSEVAVQKASEASRGVKLLNTATKLSEKWGSRGIDL